MKVEGDTKNGELILVFVNATMIACLSCKMEVKMKLFASILLVFLLIGGFTGDAVAQQGAPSQYLPIFCAEREGLLQQLLASYEELPTEYGVTPSGLLVEVITSRHGETFTLLLTKPNGTTCIVATGEGWRVNEYDDSEVGPAA